MNCAAARKRILEADLAELRATGDSALSNHVRLCAPCRSLAERILQQELALGRALAAVRPHVDLNHVVPAVASIQRPKRLWTRAVPALVAAGLAALVLSQAPIVRQPGPVEPLPDDVLPPTPSVEPPPGRSVIVFETGDRDIVIIWFY